MSDIIRKSETTPAPRNGNLDPFRAMRDLLRWDPFREMAPMMMADVPTFSPNFEVKESKDAFIFKADVPGVKDADIDVSLAGNRLTISGKREAEQQDKGDTWYAWERSYGSFSRAFTLPDGCDGDHMKASLKEGVLCVSVPKGMTGKTRKIEINAGEKHKA